MTTPRAALGRMTIVLGLVAMTVVAAIGVLVITSSNQQLTVQVQTTSTTQSTCTLPASGNGTVTITETAGQFPPCGCVLVDSNSNGSLYASTNSKVGDFVCVTASLNNSPSVYLGITNSTGSVVFSGNCVATQPPGAPSPTGDTCTADWDTAKPDPQGHAIEPGTYHLVASDYQGAAAVLEANFTLLSPGGTSTSTTNSFSTSKTVACPPNTTCGSLTYTPTGQVHVESVQATEFVCQNCGAVNGQMDVRFAVTFENVGNSPIYIPDGSNGVSTSVSAKSAVLQQVTSQVCAGTFSIAKLNPGQNYTLYGPSCFAGFDYNLVQAGSVNVSFSFNWTTNAKASTNPTDFPNSTAISAQFIFP